MCTTT